MSLESRYFERHNGAVVEQPIPRFGERVVGEVERAGSANLDDLDYSLREHLKAFESAVSSNRFSNIPAAISHLEGAASGAIKKSDYLIRQLEGERERAATRASKTADPVNVSELLELFQRLRRICPSCGGVRDDGPCNSPARVKRED